jgi:hypothetical protein
VDAPKAVDVLYPPTNAPVLLLRYTKAEPAVSERYPELVTAGDAPTGLRMYVTQLRRPPAELKPATALRRQPAPAPPTRAAVTGPALVSTTDPVAAVAFGRTDAHRSAPSAAEKANRN